MPETFYREDEVVISQEDIDNSAFKVKAIAKLMLNVWDRAQKPKGPTFPSERIISDLVEIIRLIAESHLEHIQYDDLRMYLISHLRDAIEELHETGKLTLQRKVYFE